MKMNNRYILSYKKYLYWSNKKSIQPLDFDEYVNTVLIPQEKELEDVNKVIKGELGLKEWLSDDTILKWRKINANKDYKEIKQMIIDRTSFYDKLGMRDRIYCILYDIHEKKLCKCGCDQVIYNFDFDYIRGHCNNCEEVKKKKENSYKLKTGYDNPSQNPEIKKKKEETSLKHFGVKNPCLNDDVKNKLSISNIIVQNDPKLKERIRQTNIKKYGKECYTQTEEYLRKTYATKKKNHSFNISKPEDLIYERLISKFNNVKRQYKSEKYPFACDFYINDLNLYIEINFHWVHGKNPYDKNIKECEDILSVWKEKSKRSKFYKNAINVWTIKDPLKRKTASDNNLNWIEFFDIKQFDEWFNKN